MPASIDYYLSPSSPWTYLGHARIGAVAARHGATLQVKPVDYGVIFPHSGGVPVAKRAPQRQAYRLMELERWREHLGLPLTLRPKFFPVDGNPAARLIHGAPEAVRFALAGDLLKLVWVDEGDIADPATLAAVAARHGVRDCPAAIAAGEAPYAAATQEAMARGVFGAPTWAIGETLFWGQDRLDFIERALGRAV
ncbi:MAG: 2-hydroxychromene-2-carboxylate isomerase [Proteobacteria bacterium]|nr:2-hydroxychromene-2-carboxylate isomerase [Pseudomonadota bacterium]